MWMQKSVKHTQAKARSLQLSILILKCITFIFVYHQVMTINQAWNWQLLRLLLVRGIQRCGTPSLMQTCWQEWCMSRLTSQEKVSQSNCSSHHVPISHLSSSMILADTWDWGKKVSDWAIIGWGSIITLSKNTVSGSFEHDFWDLNSS